MRISASHEDISGVRRSVADLAGSRLALAADVRATADVVPTGACGSRLLDDALVALGLRWSDALEELAHDAQVLVAELEHVDAAYARTELILTRSLAASADRP